MKVLRLPFLLLLIVGLFSRCGTVKKSAALSSPPKFEHDLLENTNPNNSETEKQAIIEDDDAALNVSPDNFFVARKSELALFIEDWHGVPHRMGGTSKKGVDCSGFVIIAYRDVLNLNFKGRRAQDLFSELEPVPEEELSFGDLVFFKIKGRRIDHVGIYLGEKKFAHASSSRGVMISSLEQAYFKTRFFKGGRYPLI